MNKKLYEALKALDKTDENKFTWATLKEGWCWQVVQEELEKYEEKR